MGHLAWQSNADRQYRPGRRRGPGSGQEVSSLDLLARHGCPPEDIENGAVTPAFISAVRELDGLARRWFAAGLRDLEAYPPESAFSVELAALFYQAILDEVEGNGYEVFRKRAYVGSLRKLAIYREVSSRRSERASAEAAAVPG
ncbi:squalene/phytoene synthase family protein [Paenibacillus sp. CC-CFT747]|nr:squalene/phytoene synthase family protein [Paenibacillus sp. CC-CFT747]